MPAARPRLVALKGSRARRMVSLYHHAGGHARCGLKEINRLAALMAVRIALAAQSGNL
jgi:hypothetical protein